MGYPAGCPEVKSGIAARLGPALTNFREHKVLPWRRYAARVATRPGEAMALLGDVVNLISAPDRMGRLRDDQPPIPLSFSIRARKQWSQVAQTQQPKVLTGKRLVDGCRSEQDPRIHGKSARR